jgi:hypothetical protein
MNKEPYYLGVDVNPEGYSMAVVRQGHNVIDIFEIDNNCKSLIQLKELGVTDFCIGPIRKVPKSERKKNTLFKLYD